MPNNRPKKLQRISQACDLCHRRSIRCRPSVENEQQQCQNCYDFRVECTYQRPSRRRRKASATNTSSNVIHPAALLRLASPFPGPGSTEGIADPQSDAAPSTTRFPRSTLSHEQSQDTSYSDDSVHVGWRSFAAASTQVINACLKTYMDMIQPFFPLFHGPTLSEQIRQRHHLVDRGLFASVMAACALAGARAKDGAAAHTPQSEANTGEWATVFFQAAKEIVFADHDRAVGFGHLRACALLALTCVQFGQIPQMHQYLGYYMTFSAVQRFHDESMWPATISPMEREERRRLFWSVYAFDIYTSAVFDSVPKSQELYSNVAYPSKIDGDAFVLGAVPDDEEANWFRGWHFITDLYRILEHSMKRLQWHRQGKSNEAAIGRLSGVDTIPDAQVMEHILNLYDALPERVKDFSIPLIGNRKLDMFGLQAVNIQVTLQLVRITILGSNQAADHHQKCEVIEQLLTTFEPMTPAHLVAFGAPLAYQFGAIGHLLASPMRNMIREDAYTRARKLLESLVRLVEGFESGSQTRSSASQGLRAQVLRLDQHMEAQRQTQSSAASAVSGTPAVQESRWLREPTASTVLAQRQRSTVGTSRRPSSELHSLSGDWSWPFDLTQEEDGTL